MNETNTSATTTVNTNLTNLSRGSFEMTIGEIVTPDGVTLKDLKMGATASITDKNVDIQCDAMLKMFVQIGVKGLLEKFADACGKRIDQKLAHSDKRFEMEVKEREQRLQLEKAESEARTKNYETSAAEHALHMKKLDKEISEIDARIARNSKEPKSKE